LERSPQYSEQRSSPQSTSLLEQEISVLNRQYKGLLAKAGTDDTDLDVLREELNLIAADMEAKSQELYTIRRKQQDYQEDRE
jgi:hypothetical protein